MYTYSPIKRIGVKDFRNIGNAIIDFKDSPIISLIGENECGKTSIVKALAVCALHAAPREQKDYIRDGTPGFGVAIELEDGTKVIRMKMTYTNSYTVTNPAGETWETTKIDSGLPKPVYDVMGMADEPETKEFLHVRTYEDNLLFVNTAASTNYKVMYNALKINQLTDAIRLGSKEANGYKQEINQAELSVNTLNRQVGTLRTFNIEPAQNIRNRLLSQMAQVQKLAQAINLSEQIKTKKRAIGALASISNANGINEIESTTLQGIQERMARLNVLRETLRANSPATELTEINLKQLETITKIRERVTLAQAERIKQATLDTALHTIDSIDNATIQVIEKCKRVLEIRGHIETSNQAQSQINTYCDQVSNWLKAAGVATETCPKCGETVIIDIDKLERHGAQ